ncbi:MAG: FlgO family outer membrane protein [Methylobacter sp.]|nr:FlgO family outer membrane protein [Methylobacter sp.]
MLKKATIFIPALFIATLSGCLTNSYYEVPKDTDLVEVSYDAVDTLQSNLLKTIPEHSLIIVNTLLNVDDLKKTSSFGRIISDQIASAFYNSGYRVIGMEMPIDLLVMQEGGAPHLSDETKKILKNYGAAAIVGGAYAQGKRTTYISLRVINADSKNIIASTDLSVPMGPDAKVLLEPKDVGSAGSRSKATADNAAEPEKKETPSELNDPK